jgi:cytochrome c553
MKKYLNIAAFTLAALLLSGCGGDKKVENRVNEIQTNDTNTVAATTATKEVVKTTSMEPTEGKQIFATRCAVCHGEKGQGQGIYPKLIGNTKEVALQKLKGYVDGTYGKQQKMIMIGQAKGIDDAQKAAVAEYIATLK